MDLANYIVEKISACRDAGMQFYTSCLNKIYFSSYNMMNELPRGSVESGFLMQHPFVLLGAWTAYKLKLDKMGDRMIKSAKDKFDKLNKGLEGRL
jgi:hypothetical protein